MRAASFQALTTFRSLASKTKLSNPSGQRAGSFVSEASEASTSGRSNAVSLISQHNLGLPCLEQQIILAKVVSTTGRSILVDPGYFGFCEFPKKSITVDQLHDPDGTALAAREGKVDIRPGDLLKFELRSFFSPYGDMHLEPLRTGGDVQSAVIWEELKQAMSEKRPVVGRVLNACKDGYAIGLSGYVALLPYRNSRVETVRRVGVLQKFYVQRMEEAKKTIVVSDARLVRDGQHGSAANVYSNI